MGQKVPNTRLREVTTSGSECPLGLNNAASPDNPLPALWLPGPTGLSGWFDPNSPLPYTSALQGLLAFGQADFLQDEINQCLKTHATPTKKPAWVNPLPAPTPNPPKITFQDVENAAAKLGIEPAMILAISKQETKAAAFDSSGRPTILFERHIFHGETKGKWDQTHPNISNKKQGGYGASSTQYDRLEEAMQLDYEAAVDSASWGRFQIMGFNHKAAGFPKVKDFVAAMFASEKSHLDALVGFLSDKTQYIKKGKEPDFEGFAAAYNGKYWKTINPNYASNTKKYYHVFLAVLKALDQIQKGSPAPTIGHSVGLKGNNATEDAAVVQALLRLSGASITIDGDAGPGTAGAIKAFQHKNFPKEKPTSLIEPDDATFKKLVETATANKAAIPALKEYLVNP